MKKPTAKIWKARIEIAGKKKKDAFDERAKRMVQMFTGEHFPDAPEGDFIVINYCYAILKAILPQIYFQDPYLFVDAGDGSTTDASVETAEAVLNHFWYKMKVKRQIKKMALDALIYGFGIGKIGYNTEISKTRLESGADYTEGIKDEYPFFRRTSPLDVVFDTDVNSLDDIKWIAVNYYLPIPDVKENYKNVKSVTGDYYNISSSFLKDKKYSTAVQDDIKRLSFWEIQDLVSGNIMAVAPTVEGFMKNISNPYKLDGFNYKFLYLNEVPDEIYPMSDLEQIKDIVLELDKNETQLLNHRARGQRKIVSEVGIWANEQEKENFFNDVDMQSAEVKAGQIDRIKVFDSSTIDAQLYNIQTELKDNLYKISATAENQLAADSTTQKTATEINKIDANSQIRNSERVDSVINLTVDIGETLIKILQQFMSKEVSVKFGEGWNDYTKKDMEGNFNVRINPGDTVKPNTAEDRQKMSQMLSETIAAMDEQGRPIVNRRAIIEMYYDKYGLTKADIATLMTPVEAPPPPPPPPEPQPQAGGMDAGTIDSLLQAIPAPRPGLTGRRG